MLLYVLRKSPYVETPGDGKDLFARVGVRHGTRGHQNSGHRWEKDYELAPLFGNALAGEKRQQPFSVRLHGGVNSGPDRRTLPGYFGSERGNHAPAAGIFEMFQAEITLDDHAQLRALRSLCCRRYYSVRRLLEAPSDRIHIEVFLALEMAIETAVRQP